MTLLIIFGVLALAAIGVTTKDSDSRMLCALLASALVMMGAK